MRLKDSLVVFLLLSVSKTLCFVNLAHAPGQHLQGNASWNVIAHQDDWEADKAVDGNTNQTYQPTCAIAQYANGYKSVWWKVWLQRIFNVAYLELYFRFGIADRLTGFSIYVYNDISFVPPSGNKGTFVYHHDPMSGCPRSLQSITVNKVAQGVAFFNDRPDGYLSNCGDLTRTSIEICEVRVMECLDGYYDKTCSNKCGNCLQGVCDKKNGTCRSGCLQNWREPLCQECVDGYYDQDCSTRCGQCREGICDKKNGSCSSGCKLNCKNPLCQECVDGYYDQDCSTRCGQCREGICDKKNGSCSSGCKLNWKEPLCQECVDGCYDKNCSTKCGNCLQGICHKKNGTCRSSCLQNWREPLCQECIDGHYGSEKCGNCLQGICDKKNGVCKNGCLQNWQGPLCQVCERYKYGPNCVFNCGHCKGSEPCNTGNGTCVNGCEPDWEGAFCVKASSSSEEERTEDKQMSKTLLLFFSVISTLLAVLLICSLIIFLYIRKTRCVQQNERNERMSSKDTVEKYQELKGGKKENHDSVFDSTKKESAYQELYTYRNTGFYEST